MDFNSLVNYVTVFLSRTGTWFLSGKSLAYFACYGSFEPCDVIVFGMLDVTEDRLVDKMGTFGIIYKKIGDDCFSFLRDGKTIEINLFSKSRKNYVVSKHRNIELELNWIICSGEEYEEVSRKRREMLPNGMWRRKIDELHPHYVQLPYCYGTILDATVPNWFINTPKRPYPTTGDLFFNEKRKENGRKLISGLYKAAEKAGIQDRLFAGFGTCLGYLMYGDYIAKDRDMDMCILSDGMTTEQYKIYMENAYNVDVIKPSRWEFATKDDGKYCWFSVGYKNPVCEDGCKSCNWFLFSWSRMWLHSKGGRWVNPRKINVNIGYDLDDAAIALAQPQDTIKDLIEVDFKGIKIKIPSTPGKCMDWYYPGWNPNGEGASAHRRVVVIKKWEDINTWRMA